MAGLRLSAHEVVSECFQSQNENGIDYKNSHHMKCLVCEEVYAGFHQIMSTTRELFEIIQNEKARKRHLLRVA